ncbi:MAG: TIGR03905 family TSCPD domain-containing protein [Faecalibacterium sp.]
MTVNYQPKGVCARSMSVTVGADHTIEAVEIIGGCNGNLKGISALIKGMKAEEAIARMEGTTCGNKATSCPDQISIALKQALEALG